MKSEDHADSVSLRDLYLRAVEKMTAAERAAFLDGACGNDLTLRSKVEALLGENAEDGFLENPAVETMTTLEIAPVLEKEGTTIGRYKLLQKVGEGGMGVVYMAEQTEPVTRKVALKIIKLGMDTKQVVARFEAERQALAMMDHPNIARVLDAGATETGRPFFVMELVRGVPITEYCDKNKLSTNERLALFILVCQAIQHAHQKGVIHRDIKASNVMVTLHDGTAVPKVIDFGIAKATNQKLTEKTLFTNYSQMIGTPAYMSPEQAEMSGLDVDTRTDVYSLGVLLYELLTGTTPFPSKELLSMGYGEMQRIIAEKEPSKPSTRLSTMQREERTVVAKNRSMEVSALGKVFKGDLDWIVMKCLEKDRARRYETANGLAMDLKRYLSNEPVFARPPNLAYKLRKAWRRNRILCSSGGLVLLALVTGISVSLWQAARATRAKNQVLLAEAEKEQEARIARQERDAARAATSRAEQESIRANAEAEANRLNLYAADMRAAQIALNELNFGVARQLLDRHRPTGNQTDLRDYAWRLLWQQSQGDQFHTIAGHSGTVHCVAFSPDGAYVVSGARDGTVSVSDVGSGTAVRSWEAHQGSRVNSVGFSPDGKLIMTGGSDGTVKLWQWPGGAPVSTLPVSGAYAQFDATVGRLFIGSGPNSKAGPSDGVNSMLLGASSNPEDVIHLSKDYQAFAVPNRDGSLVAIGSRQQDVAVVDSKGVFLRRIEKSKGALSLAFSPDSTLLAVCSGNFGVRPENEIRVHNLDTGQLLARLTNHTGRIWSLDFSPEGHLLASASSDQTVRIWNVTTWRQIQRFRGHGSEIWTVAFSPDGKRLASGSKDNTVRIWKVESASLADRISDALVTYGENARALFLNRETLFAAQTSGGSAIGIWSVSSGKLLHTFPSESFCLGENQDRSAILTVNREPPLFLRSWDLQTFKLLHEVALPEDVVFAGLPRLSLDRRSFVLNQQGKAIEIDCATGRIRQTVSLPRGFVSQVDFSPDRIVWGAISQVRQECPLISATQPTQVSWLQGHQDGVFDLRFSPTQPILATVSIDNTARLWECREGRELAVLAGHKEGVFNCDFTPDGKILATASGDRTVKLWHVATRREMLTLQLERPVTMCAFSPEGNYLATGTIDGTFRFWRAAAWEEIAAKEKSSPGSP